MLTDCLRLLSFKTSYTGTATENIRKIVILMFQRSKMHPNSMSRLLKVST